MIKENKEYIELLPNWAGEFSRKYCSKTANLYCIHGNVRDFLPHRAYHGVFSFVKITDYISEVIFGNRDVIAFFDYSCGITFSLSNMTIEYISVMHKKYPEENPQDFLSRDPTKAFFYLEKYFTYIINQNNERYYRGEIEEKRPIRMVLIIDYAETVVPNDDINNLNDVDRYNLVTLNRWANEPLFTREDVSIVMIAENLIDINKRITSSPSTIKIDIPFPDESTRLHFLQYLAKEDNQEDILLSMDRSLTLAKMANLTAGLNLSHLYQMVAQAYQEDVPITRDYLVKRKQEIIEAEASSLLEFVNTEYGLDYISGYDFVKNRFKEAVKALSGQMYEVMPMGYLIAGPIGTGKSFLVSAFASEIGIPMVRLCNFRSAWQGSTEANLERVINILKAMSPVAIMIDEADAVLGNRSNKNESGTDVRVFAQIASFMGDTQYRGKIIWFLITSRPDLLPVDLKRQGRAEEHLALFYPETLEEKANIFETMQKKLHIKTTGVVFKDIVKKITFEASGADIESILVRAKMNAILSHRAMVTKEDLLKTIQDFIPPSYPYEIELQNLVASIECTSKEMVPKKYREMSRQKLLSDIMEIKQILGEK
ncbi:MAG: ATP-binding protein [Treponema sp.]